MSIRVAVWALCAVLSIASAPGRSADTVAWVWGEEVSGAELGAAADMPGRVIRFRDVIWEQVSRHYIAEHGLAATAGELAELAAYHSEFDRRDRTQRARKLAELNQRLASGGLAPAERAWLEEFRAVLARLAQREAEQDRVPPPDPDPRAALAAPWVEMWKMNKALYEQYGGTVGLTSGGPAPFGARAALLVDYERRGLVRFLDPQLKRELYALLAQPPAIVVPPQQVDFTPYWKRPIPPSYFPD